MSSAEMQLPQCLCHHVLRQKVPNASMPAGNHHIALLEIVMSCQVMSDAASIHVK